MGDTNLELNPESTHLPRRAIVPSKELSERGSKVKRSHRSSVQSTQIPGAHPLIVDLASAVDNSTVMSKLQETLQLSEDLQLMQSKTPVSVLQEHLSRRGTTPKYELVQVEGAIHEPTFRYRVTVGDDVAMGIGRSKKEAKHSAAKAILEIITGGMKDSLLGNNICDNNTSTQISGMDDRMSGNPIGLLQELCMSRRWPPPAYETEFEEGPAHERQFTIACTVFRHKEIGTGKSKKIAKRLAAHKMWARLKDLPYESSNLSIGLDDDDEIAQRIGQASLSHVSLSDFSELKGAKIQTMTTQNNSKVSQFHKSLKASYGEKLTLLQEVKVSAPDFNCVQFLQEIAAEQSFEVTYVDIEERSASGKYQCLVQLSTLPVAVCHGSGINAEEAQTAAALNALEYLRIMSKK